MNKQWNSDQNINPTIEQVQLLEHAQALESVHRIDDPNGDVYQERVREAHRKVETRIVRIQCENGGCHLLCSPTPRTKLDCVLSLTAKRLLHFINLFL